MIRIAILFLGSLLAALPLAAAEPASWELSPYRIHVVIAVEPGSSLPSSLADDLRVDLPARAAAVVGGSWLLETSVLSAADVAAERVPDAAMGGDKLMTLAIAEDPNGFKVLARDLDLTTRLWNAAVTREVVQPEQIPNVAFQTMLAAFAPLARIDAVDKDTVTLRLKAGAIARRDRTLPTVATGAAFRPVLINFGGQGKLQAIDWTFLTATTSASGPVATCRVDTGLAGEPIPAYHPRRMRLALGVTSAAPGTQLKLVSNAASAAPLEGYEVFATAAEGAGSQSLGISDSLGIIAIPPGATAVRILDVRQGSQTLARVPVVPGLVAELQLPLPDGRQILEIETALLEAQDGLIDLAARRQALAARIKLAKKAASDDAAKLTPKLRALASVEGPSEMLSQAEKMLQAADSRTQALLQPKLDALKKLAADLAAQSPTALLDEPKPADTKPTEAKPTEPKPDAKK